jgi:hypothetical protein
VKQILSKVVIVALSIVMCTGVSFACYQCDADYNCVSGYNYGGEVCVTGQPHNPCAVYYACAAYHVPEGAEPKVRMTSCMKSALHIGGDEHEKLLNLIFVMDSGKYSGPGITVFMSDKIYRALPHQTWSYVTYQSKYHGRAFHVTTKSGKTVNVVVWPNS